MVAAFFISTNSLKVHGFPCCFGAFNLFNISEVQEPRSANILGRIEQEIDEGRYIIIYLNFTTLLNDTEHEAPYIHEALIYGYDEMKRIFYYAYGGKACQIVYDLLLRIICRSGNYWGEVQSYGIFGECGIFSSPAYF